MIKLSKTENEQLGTESPKSKFNFIDKDDWIKFRKLLVQKSKKRNPNYFDENLRAYTPGETLNLLKEKEINEWFFKMRKFKIPKKYKNIVLVSCARTKPWTENFSKKSKLYSAYNKIIKDVKEGKIEPVYFVTISEPLGVVPQELWDNFPKYDNPGLFKDDVMRTGLMTKDWEKTFLGRKYKLPFDDKRYKQCINFLGKEINKFLENHKDRNIISFVEDKNMKTTHSDMIDIVDENNINIKRFYKRRKRRETPYDYMIDTFKENNINVDIENTLDNSISVS